MESARTDQKEAKHVVQVIHRDARFRELIHLALTGAGYEVVLAPDVDEAVGQLRRHSPDAILLDAVLAEAGEINHCHSLRSGPFGRRVPLLLMGDDAPAEACARAFRLGADDSLSRPFAPAEMLLRLRRHLEQAAQRRLMGQANTELELELKRANQELEAARRRHRTQRLGVQALVDFSQKMEHRPDVAELQRHALIHLGTLLHVSGLCLFETQSPESAWLTPARWHWVGEERVRGLRLPVSAEFVRILSVEGRPLRLSEFERVPGTAWETGLVAAAGFTLIAPLMVHRQLLGLIALSDRNDGQPFEAADLELLALFAAATAQMMETARGRERERNLSRASLGLLVERLEAAYPFLAGHTRRVSRLAQEIGRRIGLPQRDLDDLAIAAALHDLGKSLGNPGLLTRPGPLTAEEKSLVRRFPEESARLAEMAGWGESIVGPIRYQQEWWSGRGGPVGLSRHAIPVGARILGVADCYDAMTSPRPYREPVGDEEARRFLLESAGDRFDPLVVEALLDLIAGEADWRQKAS